MRRQAPFLLAPLLLAASAPVQPPAAPLPDSVELARREQASAELEARRLEQIAAKAKGEAARLQAQQAAAAQAIQAAEARITTADAELRMLSARLAARSEQLRREQQPIASLLAGLAMMSRRPPLLAIANRQFGTDDYVRVRVLLDSTLPVIRRRTAALSTELTAGQRLEAAAVGARQELVRSRQQLSARRQQFAVLEQRALSAANAAGGQALSAGDIALATGEDVMRLREAERGRQSGWALAAEIERLDPAPPRPAAGEGFAASTPFAYELPASAPVTDGLGEVNPSGVKSRGVALATGRGSSISAPASGVIRFSGPFGNHDGVVIIDHGAGWKSLLVNVSSSLKVGDHVRIGDPLGRALGPISLELSQNGRRVSPALISGSSQTLSNKAKGG